MSTGLSNVELSELYKKYGHLVLRRSRAILGDQQLAEDALQNVFLKLLKHGGALRTAESKLAWVYRVVDRCCYDLLKTRRRERPTSETENVSVPEQETPNLDPHEGLLAQLLEGLNPDEQLVATLLYSDGLTQGEVSKRVGRSRQTVNRYAKIIRALAGRILHEGAYVK